MLEDSDKIKRDITSNDFGVTLGAIDSIVANIDDLTKLLFQTFERNNNQLIVTERISQPFNLYLQKLTGYIDGEDKTLQFWAATLIVHHSIKNKKAEDILLSEAKNGSSEEAYLATQILCRTRNDRILATIRDRLSAGTFPDDKMRNYFLEELNDPSW